MLPSLAPAPAAIVNRGVRTTRRDPVAIPVTTACHRHTEAAVSRDAPCADHDPGRGTRRIGEPGQSCPARWTHVSYRPAYPWHRATGPGPWSQAWIML